MNYTLAQFKSKSTRIALFVLLASILIAMQSCNVKCENPDENTGYIQKYLYELEGYYLPNLKDGIIVNDDSTFNALFPYVYLYEPIDFSQFTMIGFYITGSGCNHRIVRNLIRMANENRYHYKVTYISCGICKPLIMYCNWVLIPKLPENWIVTFQKEFG